MMPIGLAVMLAASPVEAQSGDVRTTQAVEQRTFNISAQPLGGALALFGQQSGRQISADSATVRGLSTSGVQGTLTIEEALRRLLVGTGLVFVPTSATTITIQRPAQGHLDPGVMQLEPVQVQGYPVPPQAMIDNVPSPYAGGQVATGGQLGLLGNRSVMDTPFNQTSYTARKAQDQQAKTVRDVLIDDPSVRITSSNGSNDGDNITIRGFPVVSQASSYGGLYGILPNWTTMVEIAERIEVLKGPSAMLNGIQPSGNIGGTINVVPKRAPDEPLTQFTADYGSIARFGGHADIARRFGSDKQFGVRFNGVIRAGETAIENNTDQRSLALLGLDFRGEHVRLSADLGYQYVYWGGVVPYAQLTAGVSLPWAPDASKNFGQNWNYQETKDLFSAVRAEVDLTDRVTVYASFGAHDFRREALWGGSVISITNVNGNGTSTPQRQGQYASYLTGQAGVRALVETGPVEHELALNAMTLEQTGGTTTVNGTPFSTNIYNPSVVARANIAVPTVNKTSSGGQSSVGIADTLSLANRRIQLTAGARWQQVKATQFDGTTGVATSQYDETAITPAVALVFKPWENVSIYGNWIQGLQQGAIVGAQFANAGTIFPPFKSTQYEAGVKVDWGKLTTTVSAFQITQPSTITDVATNTLVLAGEQRNQGLEFNFFGEPVPGIRLLGGAMFLDAVLTKTQGNLTNGWWAPNAPNVQLRFAGEWDTPFVPGLTLDGRVVYTSSQFIDTLYPRRTIPDWTRFDIGARYTFDNVKSPTGKPVVIRFNVDNVLDTNYWMAPNFLGSPRTFRLSTTFDF
jgi:iron complex outermembrane receptor protein